MNITERRFLELIKKCHLIIKKDKGFSVRLENYWADKEYNNFAMFFNFETGKWKEYVKIYLEKYSKPLRISVYLYRDKKDILINSFTDYNEFKEWLINLSNNINNYVVKELQEINKKYEN